MYYIVDRPVPQNCHECPCMRYEHKAYDDPIGCVYTGKTYNWSLKDRPADCPIVDAEDDLR